MYKLTKSGVIKDGNLHIPNHVGNRHWDEYQKWLKIPNNTPEPTDPDPVPDVPEPTVSELIQAIDLKDKGDTTKWDEIKTRGVK
jgi:hypothetical protein